MEEEEEDYEEKETGKTCGVPEIHGEDDSSTAYIMQRRTPLGRPTPAPTHEGAQSGGGRGERGENTEVGDAGRRKVEPQPGRAFRPYRPRRGRAASSAAARA